MKTVIGILVIIVICQGVAIAYLLSKDNPEPAVATSDSSTVAVSRARSSAQQQSAPARQESKKFDGVGYWRGLEFRIGMPIQNVKDKWHVKPMPEGGSIFYMSEDNNISFGTPCNESSVTSIAFREGWEVFGVKVGERLEQAKRVLGKPRIARDNIIDDDYMMVFDVKPHYLEVYSDNERGKINAMVWAVIRIDE
ncbi:MAG TPA: hypothetical protein PKM88_04095 [bacterium]|nr:hypothetical protein [bacterium]